MDICPIDSSTVGPIVDILVERHRSHSPLGAVHVLAEKSDAESLVRAALATGVGYGAVAGASLTGFLIAPFPSMPGVTTARLGFAHHAARPGAERAAYRALYEAAAADLVASGVTYHSLPVLADDTNVTGTFFELEFGVDQIDGLLAIPSDLSAGRVSTGVRSATEADVDDLVDLAIELQRFHSRAPMFQPARGFDVVSTRRAIEAGIDDERSIVLVIDGDDELLGMAQAGPASAYRDTVDIGMNVISEGARSQSLGTSLLRHLLGWAAARSYRYCTVGWTSSNPVSDPFYRSRGFTAVRYRLHRRIDPHISWANDSLDERNFGHRRRSD